MPEVGAASAEMLVRFMCSSTCTRPSVNRRPLLALFTLEVGGGNGGGGGEGAVIGRERVSLVVVSCPGRDRKKAEEQYALQNGGSGGGGGGGGGGRGGGNGGSEGKKRLMKKGGSSGDLVPPPGKKLLKPIKQEPVEDGRDSAGQPLTHVTTAREAGEEAKEEEDDDDNIRVIAVKGKKKWREMMRLKEYLDLKYAMDENERRQIVDRTKREENGVFQRFEERGAAALKRSFEEDSAPLPLPHPVPQQQQLHAIPQQLASQHPETPALRMQRKPLPKKPKKSPHNSGSSLHEFFEAR